MRDLMTKLLERWAGRYYAALVKELEGDKAALKSSLEAEQAKVRQLADAQKANAEHAKRIGDLEQELAETEAALRVAKVENTLLAEIHEEDVARRRRQRSIYDRDRAQATAATPVVQEGDE